MIRRALATARMVFPQDPLRARIAKGALWSLSGSTIAQSLTLLVSIPVARILGGESYGELGLIQSTIGAFVLFAEPALGVAATKHIAQLRNAHPERTGGIIGIVSIAGVVASAVMALALWIGAPYLANQTLDAPDLTDAIRLASLVLLLSGIVGVQNGILAGFESFKAMARVSFFRSVIGVPLIIAATWTGHLEGTILALAAMAGVAALMNHQAIRHEVSRHAILIRYNDLRSEWHILHRFSLPALCNAALVVTSVWLANVYLVRQPNGFGEMGVFNASNQWRIAVLFLPTMLARPVLPMLSELLSKSAADYREVLKLNLLMTGGLSLVLASLVALCSPFIMANYGSEFENMWPVVALLAFSAVFSAISGVVGNAIWSSGRIWQSVILNFGWAAAFMVSVVTIGSRGSEGLALAYLISYATHLVVVVAYLRFWMWRSMWTPQQR